jgi:hypothetical protein
VAYKRNPMVFNQYCLDFFAKVPSQAIQYGPWRSLRPSSKNRQGPRPGMVIGREQAYYDFINRHVAGWFNHRAEAGDFGFSTYMLAWSMRWGGGTLN